MTRLDHIKYGIRERIPICCIIRFVFFPVAEAAVKRGGRCNKHGPYVPCLIFHRAHEGYYDKVSGCNNGSHLKKEAV
jgi:hypothetical protein